MTTSPVDPNRVLLTGENSFLRLAQEDAGPHLTRVSHWRVLLSPAGPGHVLFLKSDVVGNEVLVYSDNIALTRWLQVEIESLLFPEFANLDLPVIDAAFTKSGDGRSFWTEKVESEEDIIALTWYDFLDPFVLRLEAGSNPTRPHGVYSCFVPARQAQVTFNGLVAEGKVFLEKRGEKQSSAACLAWSETWVRP